MHMRNTLEELKKVLPDDSIMSQCIHCGICLSSCPTYEFTKLERSSPRGRIRLMRSVVEGKLPVTKTFADEMNFCLDCQACETACPAGVRYGLMVEAARNIVDSSQAGRTFGNYLKKYILKYVVASKRNLKSVSRILFLYQNSGLQKFIRKSGLLKLIPGNLNNIEKLTPPVSKKFSDSILPEIIPARKERKFKTAFLTGCLMNVMFADINIETVEVLTLLGCEVVVPDGQVCCGSLNEHNGDRHTALDLAKKNIDVFSKYDYDFLISNSAGCGAFMKQYGYLLKDDEKYREKAENFSKKIRDITEFISENHFEVQWGRVDETVTYHDACHLIHSQKIFEQPRNVLKRIPGIILNEMKESTWCCGSAGIYNVLRYNDSTELLNRKINNIKNTNAPIVVTGNPGCISQLKNGVRNNKLNVKVLHPVTLIKRSLTRAEK